MMNKFLSREIWKEIEQGANLLVSVSGGKDSDCMAIVLYDKWKRLSPGQRGRFSLIHADVVGFEWPQSWPHCQDMADRLNVPIFMVSATYRDGSPKTFLGEVERKITSRPDAPPWSSAACRWCTSDLKRGPISKWIRNAFPRDTVVYSAMGLRAQESPARAKKPVLALRPSCQAPIKNRIVYDWNPILDYTLEDVWNVLLPDGGLDMLQWHQEYCQDTGRVHQNWEYHPAYVYGNDRVSCAICVLANENDLRIGIEYNPDIYQEIVRLEEESGFTFRSDKSIVEVKNNVNCN